MTDSVDKRNLAAMERERPLMKAGGFARRQPGEGRAPRFS